MKQQDDPFGTQALKDILADKSGDLLSKFIIEGQVQGLFFGKTIEQVEKSIEAYIADAEKAEEIDPFANLKGLDKLIFDTVQDMAFGMEALKDQMEAMSDEELTTRIQALGIDFEELGLKVEDVIPVLRALNKETKENKGVLAELEPTLDNIATAYERLQTAIASGEINLDTAVAQYREFLKATGPVGEAMAEIGEEVESAATALSDDLTNALLEGEDALDAFDNFAKQIVASVISSFMDLLVIQPIVDAILGAFNIPNTSGSGMGGTKKNAGGGSAYGGQPMLVGERGPELFVPHSAGNIINNMGTKDALGGGTVVINQSINFSTGIVPTVRAEVLQMMPQIAEATKSAVAGEAARGGNFQRMIVGRS
jgi:hypothetical protein